MFESDVLGIFSIVRGFADLKELAAVSAPFTMETGDSTPGAVVGHQRDIDEVHARDIRRYLEGSDSRFLPEVILSLRADLTTQLDRDGRVTEVRSTPFDPIVVKPARRKGFVRLSIDEASVPDIVDRRRIRRIDGNHRLVAAADATPDPQVPRKFRASFCLLLLGPEENEIDDYTESLIFHTLNSTAMPLASEHGLALMLGQDAALAPTSEQELASSPQIHLTRLLRNHLQGLTEPAKARMGQQPLSALAEVARQLLEEEESERRDLEAFTSFAERVFAGLNDLLTFLNRDHAQVAASVLALPLAVQIWQSSDGPDHGARLAIAWGKLDGLARWLERSGLTQAVDVPRSAGALLAAYETLQAAIPKRVFLARWYPRETSGEDHQSAKLRLDQIKRALKDIKDAHAVDLELVDMGTKIGGTYLIHPKMYEAIASSDIIVVDLTGLRPNVCIEAGYALKHHEKGRLLFLFQPRSPDDKVPFDLNTFRYQECAEAAEIPEAFKPHLEEILREAGAIRT